MISSVLIKILEKLWVARIVPVSSIADEFDCFKVTFKRFPPSWCQHLWGLTLQREYKTIVFIKVHRCVINIHIIKGICDKRI